MPSVGLHGWATCFVVLVFMLSIARVVHARRERIKLSSTDCQIFFSLFFNYFSDCAAMPYLSMIFRHVFFADLAFFRSFLAARGVKSMHDCMESSHGIIG